MSDFAARISGVTRFGLFVTVTETGASGIVPFATLPDDYWQYDEREQTLTGRRTQKVYRLAQEVEVLLSEANPVTGGMVFHVLGGRPSRKSAAFARETAPPPVIRIGVLLVLFVIGRAQAETLSASGLDQDRLTAVYSEALTFMLPRILDPVPVPLTDPLGPAGPDRAGSQPAGRRGGQQAATVPSERDGARRGRRRKMRHPRLGPKPRRR